MTYCCSSLCEKRYECAKWDGNATLGEIVPVENFYSFGSGSISSKGVEETYWCGPLGNYAMFEPIQEEFKVCPLKFLKKNPNIPTEYIQCEKDKCAWWCSWSNSCTIAAIPAEISDRAHDIMQTIGG